VRFLVLLACCAAANAQPDARQLVRQSIQNGEAAWRHSFDYACTKRDIVKQLDTSGREKQVDDDLYQTVPLGYSASFDVHVEHDNEPVAPGERAKEEQKLASLRAESPAQKQHMFARLKNERSYMAEVPDAFDFRITGTANFPTGPAWVIEATPHPGYEAKSRYAHMFPYMRGTLWIDKQDVQWVKADAVATSPVTFGFFIARLAKGSHIVLQQMKLPDGAWVAKSIEARASARTFLLFHHRFQEDITYSGYHTEVQAASAAGRNQVTASRVSK
jgi:hypothetical protein